MELKLSCYCCGSTEFSLIAEVVNCSHMHCRENTIKDNRVICSRCGLEDYIKNLKTKVCK